MTIASPPLGPGSRPAAVRLLDAATGFWSAANAAGQWAFACCVAICFAGAATPGALHGAAPWVALLALILALALV